MSRDKEIVKKGSSRDAVEQAVDAVRVDRTSSWDTLGKDRGDVKEWGHQRPATPEKKAAEDRALVLDHLHF